MVTQYSQKMEIYHRKQEEPVNVLCSGCNCWLARIFSVKTEEGYFCRDCFEKKEQGYER